MTINLENRKEVDVNLIVNATEKRPRTFTELLHITRLPRKTLSSRLKELCATGVIVKKEGAYEANGDSRFVGEAGKRIEKISKIFHNRKLRTGLMFVALLLSFSVSGYVLAMLLSPQPEEKCQEPALIGNFIVALDVNNVVDLYSWQVAIVYNSSQLKVLEMTPGGFVGEEFPQFVNSTDSFEDLLLLAGSLLGEVQGKNGGGRLAIVVFGYFTEDYDEPKIVPEKVFETFLLNSQLQRIPINDSTLTLTLVEKP